MKPADLAHYEVGLLKVIGGSHRVNLFAGTVGSEQLLLETVNVPADEGIRRVKNNFRGPVILFKPDDLGFGIFSGEVQNHIYVCAAPAVN